jgi:hypothetical protein
MKMLFRTLAAARAMSADTRPRTPLSFPERITIIVIGLVVPVSGCHATSSAGARFRRGVVAGALTLAVTRNDDAGR